MRVLLTYFGGHRPPLEKACRLPIVTKSFARWDASGNARSSRRDASRTNSSCRLAGSQAISGGSFNRSAGKQVEIVQFGTWNREAGPDFQGAAIRIDGGPVIGGSIEFDLSDRSWETHGHAINPAFEDTILHVFVESGEQAFFTRTKSHRNVLQVRVDPAALPDAFSANVPLARPGRCQAPLQGLPEERVLSVLAAASQFRLQRKAARLRTMAENHGRTKPSFKSSPRRLVTKQNKLPFTLLAQRLPLRVLRKRSGASSKRCSSASPVFSPRQICQFTRRNARLCPGSFGIDGGRTATKCSGWFSRRELWRLERRPSAESSATPARRARRDCRDGRSSRNR